MKSVNGINWKINSIPERLILKNKQKFNISYLLSKIFLDKKYSDDEIYNSIYKLEEDKLIYNNQDFIIASKFVLDCYKNKKKILIFGDYDVDGYSSIYLLYDFFLNNNIKCDYFIPNRFSDGYGPNTILLKKLINRNIYDLIIFVDCGSNSIDEINFLESHGLKTIVIDHHQIYDQKKFEKSIIINPLKNPFDKKYSIFCATTLVYLFIKYLMKIIKVNKKINLDKYLFFSAIATICDQMPLRGYNKMIVKKGFKNFNLNNFKNFNKLININKKLKSTDVGYTLGPILNSASRLGYSYLPLSLLIEKENIKVKNISEKLILLNEKRKKIQTKTFYLLNKNFENLNQKVIFKFEKNLNEGLLGIIAANFVEIYNKPSFIFTNSGNLIKCSSRSVNGYNIGNILYSAIKKKLIINGGGHSMAGGCTLEKDKLNEFEKFVNLHYIKNLKNFENIKFYTSDQNFDSLLFFAKKDFNILEPLGNNNNSPFFKLRCNKIIKYKIIKNLHLHLIIKNMHNKSCTCLAFNVIGTKLGDLLMYSKKEIDLIVQINNNIIKKNSDFNLIIKDAIA
tara:strand:- start:89 stop:1783 length:1695 start_codon:yes stop_codon:yes gene_type:complete